MAPSSTAPVRAAEAPLHLLLVEDDEGDAFLVSELLKEEDPSIVVRHVRSLAAAVESLSTEIPDCVLLDLGLPDATGLGALERLRAVRPGVAHLVLTGDRDVQRGVEAVAAGAQDYLIKGSVDGDGLRRAVLYAVERRQADHVRERLRAAEILAEEATRLERGLLPVPILHDRAIGVGTGYRPGRERTLLGGDFYDAVEMPDGSVHLVIGDVAGHGPDEAALGVCLRVAWRTLTLAGAAPEAVLPDPAARPRPRTRRRGDLRDGPDGDRRPGPPYREPAQRRPPAARPARRRRRRARSTCARACRSASSTAPSWPVRSLSLPHAVGPPAVDRRPDRGTGGAGPGRAPGDGRADRPRALAAGRRDTGTRAPARSSAASSTRSCAATAGCRSTTSPRCS